MESRKLISLSDYIFDEHNKMNQITEQPEAVKSFLNVLNYAKFLSMPLTLGMFVPCDEYYQPMSEHLQYDDKLCDFCPLEKKGVYSVPGGSVAGCEGSRCDVAGENYQDAYKEALDNVIFTGFTNYVEQTKSTFEIHLLDQDREEFITLLKNMKLEDVLEVNFEFELTQSAIIKYQI